MRRREFIAGLGGAAVWPVVVHGQAPPVIGFLHSGSPASYGHVMDAFRSGLAEKGFVEGGAVTVVNRWAEDHFDRLPALASWFVKKFL